MRRSCSRSPMHCSTSARRASRRYDGSPGGVGGGHRGDPALRRGARSPRPREFRRTPCARSPLNFALRRRRSCYGRMGLSTQPFGTTCQWLIQLLNLLTGNLDAPGGALPTTPAIAMTGPGTRPGGPGRFASRVAGLPSFGGEMPVADARRGDRNPRREPHPRHAHHRGQPVLSTPNGRAPRPRPRQPRLHGPRSTST